VHACISYAEGVHWLESDLFDFVLVSQGSRMFEGRVILERAKEIDQHTPVLVLAHCLDIACYIEAMQMGALDYFEKPLPPAEVLRIVKDYIRPRIAMYSA
jgi:DNA-binding NtrC family response regulator